MGLPEMRVNAVAVLLLVLCGCTTTLPYSAGPTSGMVADAETQLPVPGALVVAVWTLQSGSDYGINRYSSSRKPSATRTGSIVCRLGAGPEARWKEYSINTIRSSGFSSPATRCGD